MRFSSILPVVASLLFAAAASAEVYFEETFDKDWESRWTNADREGLGAFVRSAGTFFNDAEADMGIKTSQDARFYAISAPTKDWSNKGKDLVLQFSVKHEQNIDCGGGYIKLLPAGLEPKKFNGDSEYNIMFGPDICGATRRVHVIFNYKGENKLIKKTIPAKSDELTHLYTLIVKPDQTYQVLIDQKEVEKGSLIDDWDFLPPKKIKDPAASKPAEWDERAKIADPEDKKPDGWDDIPAQIADPDAAKPEDWDDDMDGEWEAPKIANPDFKGEWKPKMIDNPAYKGVWVHPEIDNPDFKEDPEIYAYKSHGAVGFDLWQVKAGTIFDNILVTDDIAYAAAFADKTYAVTAVGETRAKDIAEEEARKKREEEEAKAKAEADKKAEESDSDDADEDEEKKKDAGEKTETETVKEKPAKDDDAKEEL